MFLESEFIILTIMVFSLTAAVWIQIHGFPFSLADLTTIQNKPKQTIRRSMSHPMLLPTAIPLAAPLDETTDLTTDPQAIEAAAGTTPLDQTTQLSRVSKILQSAFALADKAERLHNAAHEQLDGAHYALQNLLDELSTVMTITSPAIVQRDASYATSHAQTRQTYVTAIAA